MAALDGNAIGGLLHEVFGKEMTATVGTCANCGAREPVAEFAVYLRGPGTVARCRDCAQPASGDRHCQGHELRRPDRPS